MVNDEILGQEFDASLVGVDILVLRHLHHQTIASRTRNTARIQAVSQAHSTYFAKVVPSQFAPDEIGRLGHAENEASQDFGYQASIGTFSIEHFVPRMQI
jgi:hypothetical protein